MTWNLRVSGVCEMASAVESVLFRVRPTGLRCPAVRLVSIGLLLLTQQLWPLVDLNHGTVWSRQGQG
jgi:hypothetical protein